MVCLYVLWVLYIPQLICTGCVHHLCTTYVQLTLCTLNSIRHTTVCDIPLLSTSMQAHSAKNCRLCGTHTLHATFTVQISCGVCTLPFPCTSPIMHATVCVTSLSMQPHSAKNCRLCGAYTLHATFTVQISCGVCTVHISTPLASPPPLGMQQYVTSPSMQPHSAKNCRLCGAHTLHATFTDGCTWKHISH